MGVSEPWAEVIRHEAARRIVKFLRYHWALNHALALMHWDLETYMPREGVKDRSIAIEELSAEVHRIERSDELARLVEEAGKHLDEMNDYERGLVRVVARRVRIARSIPEDLVRRKARVTSEATVVWAKAKKESNFALFKPYLKQIVEIERVIAEKLGYEEHPYDALLDLYEEGLRTKDVEKIFSILVPETKRILEKIMSDEFYPQKHPLEEARYEKAKAQKLVKTILDYLEWPWNRGRFDESPHPFTIDMGVYDVRITVRYEGYDIKRVVYSTMHEYGHALYELQQDPRLDQTPLAGGASLGVHESQSRFWENIIGRSPWFTPTLKKMLDETVGLTKDVDVVDLYRYVNTVRPSLIRVDADEVTYNLHIYLRFDIERKLIEESLSVNEVPEAWNQYMEKLLGVKPRNDAEGVLQDIHWSHGSIGYFPTYTLGNVVAAMIWKTLGGSSSELITSLRLKDIREWLHEKMHVWGKTYPPKELVSKVTGRELDPTALVEYLEWKYTRLPDKIEEVISR